MERRLDTGTRSLGPARRRIHSKVLVVPRAHIDSTAPKSTQSSGSPKKPTKLNHPTLQLRSQPLQKQYFDVKSVVPVPSKSVPHTAAPLKPIHKDLQIEPSANQTKEPEATQEPVVVPAVEQAPELTIVNTKPKRKLRHFFKKRQK